VNKIRFGNATSTADKATISKIGAVSTDRDVAQAPAPAVTAGQAENKIQIYSYFTSAPVPGQATQQIYDGSRMWARVTLTLLTAGPVAVGQQSNISPVTSGNGQLLQTNIPVVIDVAKGNRLYGAATGVNRVNVSVQAVPWLETITGLVNALASGALVGRVAKL
jgi:hypothetical protein